MLFLPHIANELEAAPFVAFCHLAGLPHQLTRQLMFGSQIAEKLMIVRVRVGIGFGTHSGKNSIKEFKLNHH